MLDNRYSNNAKIIEKLVDYISEKEFDNKIHFVINFTNRAFVAGYYDKRRNVVEVSDPIVKKILNISYTDVMNYGNGNLLKGIFTAMIEREFEIENGKELRKGYYRRKPFMRLAEEHGCKTIHDDKYGWSIIDVPQWAKDYLEQCKLDDYNYYKPVANTLKPRVRMSKRWQCPGCGTIIRSTCNVDVKCNKCNLDFVYADNYKGWK